MRMNETKLRAELLALLRRHPGLTWDEIILAVDAPAPVIAHELQALQDDGLALVEAPRLMAWTSRLDASARRDLRAELQAQLVAHDSGLTVRQFKTPAARGDVTLELERLAAEALVVRRDGLWWGRRALLTHTVCIVVRNHGKPQPRVLVQDAVCQAHQSLAVDRIEAAVAVDVAARTKRVELVGPRVGPLGWFAARKVRPADTMTDLEREEIRQTFRNGMALGAVAIQFGRDWSLVERVCRDIKPQTTERRRVGGSHG